MQENSWLTDARKVMSVALVALSLGFWWTNNLADAVYLLVAAVWVKGK